MHFGAKELSLILSGTGLALAAVVPVLVLWTTKTNMMDSIGKAGPRDNMIAALSFVSALLQFAGLYLGV